MNKSVTDRLPALDGLRALAVAGVIIFHFWVGHLGPASFLQKLSVWGQTGVDLFFVLSGFLITRILLSARDTKRAFLRFYARRALRIFPLYYATLIVFYLVAPVIGRTHLEPFSRTFWFWTYLQNIPLTFGLPTDLHGPNHFWSLAVEEHFYLFWPILVLNIRDNRFLLRLTAVGVGLSLVCRLALLHYEPFYFTLCRLDGLAIGSALAIWQREKGSFQMHVRTLRRVFVALGLGLAATQIAISGSAFAPMQVAKSTLMSILYALLIVLVIEAGFGKTLNAALGSRPLQAVGKYSYGMYVFHPFLLLALHEHGLPYSLWAIPFGFALSYVAAWLSWHAFEKHFLSLKRYFEYGQDGVGAKHAAAVNQPA